MSDERERVTHPSWCDREACTAPEFRMTSEEYKSGASGSHYSATLSSRTNDLQLFLAQSECPWDTEAYLVIRNGDDGVPQTVPMSESGGGFALYALLGQEVTESVRKWPALYAERFPYVQRAIEDEADEATADAVTPRDPVELEERMTAEFLADEETDRTADWSSRERLHTIAAYEIGDQAAEELLRDVERTAKGCTHPPDEPCFGKARPTSPQHVEPDTQDVGEGTT